MTNFNSFSIVLERFYFFKRNFNLKRYGLSFLGIKNIDMYKIKLNKNVEKLSSIFYKNGYKIFLVGGSIRDSLLKNEINDFDFATDATPEEMIAIFPNVIPVGIEHGTVMILLNGESFEVTTFRTDGKYSDFRRPDSVNFVKSIDEDLKRRDFTINGFAYDIVNKKLIDNFDGISDLKNGKIRAIGDPLERFNEDPLRMIRACRFASKLSFEIDQDTLDGITVLAYLIKNISPERIRDELIKIMESDKPSIALEYLRVTGLMKIILPELLEGYGVNQNKFHKFDVYYHNIYSCDAAPKDDYAIRLAALFHDIAKPITKKGKQDEREENNDEETENPLNQENSFYNHEIVGAKVSYRILKRLKFSNDDIKKITHLVKYHMFYYTDEWTDGAVRRFIRNVGVENMEDLFILRNADRVGNGTKQGESKHFLDFKDRIKAIIDEDAAFKITDLNIDGNDIMSSLKIKSGPLIGEILNYLLELVLDNPEYNNREKLLSLAIDYYNKKSEYSQSQYGELPQNLGKF